MLHDEYLGLDYRVALDLHLYFVTFRDVLSWALAQGLTAYESTPLDYDPKLHLGFDLLPLDLYVAPASPALAPLLKARAAVDRADARRADPAPFPKFIRTLTNSQARGSVSPRREIPV